MQLMHTGEAPVAATQDLGPVCTEHKANRTTISLARYDSPRSGRRSADKLEKAFNGLLNMTRRLRMTRAYRILGE